MVVPDVDLKLLEELESMGFSKERSTRALHFSGEWAEVFHSRFLSRLFQSMLLYYSTKIAILNGIGILLYST